MSECFYTQKNIMNVIYMQLEPLFHAFFLALFVFDCYMFIVIMAVWSKNKSIWHLVRHSARLLCEI